MMRFITLTNKLMDAVFDFCMKQDECQYEYMDSEVRNMLDTVFSELRKIRNGVLPVNVINRYNLTFNDDCEEDIMPDDAGENNVLCCEAVHLATIRTDVCSSDDGETVIERSCEIIYDVGGNTIIPVYTVAVSNSDMTSVYRVKCDYIEEFDTVEFMIALGVQLADRLMNASDFLGKVCEIP